LRPLRIPMIQKGLDFEQEDINPPQLPILI
jgi:hypothetical protein